VVGLSLTNPEPAHWETGYWAKFAFIVAMTAFFAVFAWFVPQRRPGYLDRIFGASYRRAEIKVAYVMRLAPLVAGITAIAEVFTGSDFDRAAHLALVLLMTGLAAAFVLMRPAAPDSGAPPVGRGPGEMISSTFGSTMHDSPSAL
jgi:heme/copper-type cytochrome/quinol oxidase subunit 3